LGTTGHRVLAACALFLTAGVASAQQGSPPARQAPPSAVAASPLEALRFLVGTWRGEGGGEPGKGSGSASFVFDLDGNVLVRRSHSEYPAAGDKPALIHDDLMIISAVPETRKLEAVYFDNEGHTIEYSVEVAPGGKRVVLTSEEEPATPTFRLTYALVTEDVVDVTFETAPPDRPTAFKTHVSGRARRAALP
jgi:hypothetical protein